MRIILLCNQQLSDFDQKVMHHIQQSSELRIVGMLVNIKRKPGVWNRVKRELRKGRGGYVLIQALRAVMNKFKKNNLTPSVGYAINMDIPFLEIDSLYNTQIYKWIQDREPDILFLRGFGIIKNPILNIAPYGVLSYHHADIFKYRGGPPFFWELFYNEKQAGITLQILDEGLDTGTVVLQKFIPINRDSWSSLRKRAYKESEEMAVDALLMLKKENPFRNPIGPQGKLVTLPNLQQWLELQIKVALRKILE